MCGQIIHTHKNADDDVCFISEACLIHLIVFVSFFLQREHTNSHWMFTERCKQFKI